MILQTRRKFRRPTWVAYVDFRIAFDSANRQPLWLLLKTKGVPQKLTDLLEDLYTNTVSCVRVDGQVSDWFSISAGVRQGCAVAPNLFLEQIDWITRRSHSPRLRAFRSQDYGDVVCQKLGISGHLSSRYRRLNSDSFFESWCMLRNVERCGNGHYCVHHCSGFVQKFDCGFHDFPGQNYFIPNYSRYFYACLYKQYN